MSLYADSSALLKRHVAEPDSSSAMMLLESDPVLVTSRLTIIEVRRNLPRLLAARDAATARAEFQAALEDVELVELDAALMERASTIAETTQVKSLDAIHLAAAHRAGGGPTLTFVTFDLRQAQAARTLGFTVVGV